MPSKPGPSGPPVARSVAQSVEPLLSSRSPARRWLILLLVLGLLGGVVYGLFRALQYTEFTDHQREGPPALIEANEARQLWVLVKYEERLNFGFRGSGDRFSTRYHLALHCHDIVSGRKVWSRRLRSVSEHDDGYNARARILGQEGDTVWLFVHDQPVAVAASDGAVRATGLDIAAKNPSLQSLFPNKLEFYSFDRGPVMVLADARRMRIGLPGYAATPYMAASEEEFSRRQFTASRWIGSYATRDFVTPHGRPGARWLGLLTRDEARDTGDDAFGSNLADARRNWQPEANVRRSLWTARIGQTRQFSEGSHERIVDVQPLPQSPNWLRAGLMVQAGTRSPLLLDDSDLLVMHRTRIDAEGRAAVARVRVNADNSVQTQWTTNLPFTELGNRWQLPLAGPSQPRPAPERLLMVGQAEIGKPGASRMHEFVAALDLRSGAVQGWNLTTDQAWTPP